MSKAFDAAKHHKRSSTVHKSDTTPAPPQAERRRCARWNAHVPVFVYGHACSQAPFHEVAYSAVVSERGALLIMTTAVPVGEKLLLANRVTQANQECRVVHVGLRDGPSVEVAIEFTDAAPQFWRVTAPPRRVVSISPTEQHRNTR
jgi:hypothetical protein